MTTERQRQEKTAFETQENVKRFHFIAWDKSFTFSAVAPSEDGAFRVANAEHPGMMFTTDGVTHCTCARLEVRRLSRGLSSMVTA